MAYASRMRRAFLSLLVLTIGPCLACAELPPPAAATGDTGSGGGSSSSSASTGGGGIGVCDDGNDCTVDEPVGSACVFVAQAKGAPCIGGECVGGMCCDPGSCSFLDVNDAGAVARHCIPKCPLGQACDASGTCK